MHQTKQCLRCQQTKPLSQFGKNRNNPDGLNSYCKPCASLLSRESRHLAGLKHWLTNHEGICAKCGSKSRVGTQWLLGFMLPVSICMICNIEYLSMKDITVDDFYRWLREKHCLRCGHTWLARSPNPIFCPSCKSSEWQEPEEITNE